MQDCHVSGIATDILKEACVLEKIQCPVQLVPWIRAYKTVQDNANTLIYAIAKTPRQRISVALGRANSAAYDLDFCET